MLRFEDEEKTSPAIIKVLGIGGGGMNAVSRMANSSMTGVEYVIMNTDEQVLKKSPIENKINLGSKVTRGMGAGGDPELGTKAAEEDKDRILSVIQGADLVFVTAGMGGGTGTGAAPIVAKIAKEAKCLVVGVVTIPFSFEGRRRMEFAKRGVDQLRNYVDTLILVNNESIFQVVDRNTPIDQAFRVIDDILLNAVRGISDIVNNPGIINVDFADVKAIMKDTGDAVMGVGEGSGESKVLEAVGYAIDNVLLDSRSIMGATSLLINVTGGSDLTISDWNEVSQIITSQVDPNANIIVGLTEDPQLQNRIRVTVIATGFNKRPNSLSSGLRQPEAKVNSFRKVVGIPDIEQEEESKSLRREPERGLDQDTYRNLKNKASARQEDYDIPAFLRRGDKGR
ncbi:cell division protein FtsZ [Leptospira perolatii]|uniref:Cell division protein FtsZ n=1 Tax=Leptospira perolatii TaxID=2023191 RepID=A0A2M9ZSC3_9LEPT|nr:cell division protein FtsZ [Leptospira perolatii]PJZ71446.1 cell division protein FtsZ [Leptospira perolatii]PJZ74980.1 cell division protein FtsZ [Leptospira perolatii]